MGIIYMVENVVNGKHYVGQTVQKFERRKTLHKSQAKNNNYRSAFHNAINKYGWDSFKWTVIDEHDDQDVLDALERLHISRYESLFPNGYNLTDGGNGGKKYSNESKRKMRLNHSRAMLNKAKSLTTRRLSSLSKQKREWVGCTFNRHQNPEKRCWISKIRWNGRSINLGYYEDPLSASLVYKLVWSEIYGDDQL